MIIQRETQKLTSTFNELVNILKSFVIIAELWTLNGRDRIFSCKYVHRDRDQNNKVIIKLSGAFLRTVKCFYKQFTNISRFIDKPNVHRLLELATHTTPT